MKYEHIESRDYFSDPEILVDPFEFFRSIYAESPVYQMPGRDYVVVTGFEECLEVAKNSEDFSSIFSFSPYGAGLPLPFTPQGDDISEQIEAQRRPEDLLVTQDGAFHAANRSILSKLFTPSRLRDNEVFMKEYAGQLAEEMAAKGKCNFVEEFGLPFSTNVIADLLGVPLDDRQLIVDTLASSPPVGGEVKADDVRTQVPHYDFMMNFFESYIRDRRDNPKNDVLNELATATYPDGSTPDLMEIVKLAMFLFLGGRDSASKFIASAVYFAAEIPGLQEQLRQNRDIIPSFIEEALRLQGTTKATFRLARKKTRIGDVEIPAGTKVVVAFSAGNRDPRRWDNPNEFQMDRPKIREHLAFGRGPHTCMGAPLARSETRIVLNQLFDHTSNLSLDPEKHGKPADRVIQFEPSYIVRGLLNLDLVLTR